MDSKLLTPQEVADILKIKKSTVYEMIKRGALPAKKMGKQLRILPDSITRYLTSEPSQKKEVPKFFPILNQDPETSPAPTFFILSGQDELLDLICNKVSQNFGDLQILRSYLDSYNGLYAMYQEQINIATCNLWDSKTDTYNLPFVQRLFPGEEICVYHLCNRLQGFYVAKGNPKNIYSFDDLVRQDITFINREKGSGSRVLLDSMLKSRNLDPQKINGYLRSVNSALMTASIVAKGGADCAIGPERMALQIDKIDFIPLKEESLDLVVRKEDINNAPVSYILCLLKDNDFREEILHLKGYYVSNMGQQIF
ncbi:MAG: substrate-binding domain-containing protein [Acidaminococcaceae bacterium]